MYCPPQNCLKNYLALLLLALAITSCKPGADDEIKPSDFTKVQRETLGDIIQNAITNNDREFTILPNIPPYDAAYQYLQRLYGQAYDAIQKDIHSPSADRWDNERPWEVHLLLDNQKNAFILPGGHLYLTTGMLKALKSEHELYFIMAFELTLMNEKYLFNRILNSFNTTILVDMISGSPSPNSATPNSLALALSEFDYVEEDILETDEQTIQLICETSIWDPTGLLPIYTSSIDEAVPWIDNRDYPGRVSRVTQLPFQGENSCGIVKESGEYADKVLSNLP